MTAPTHKSSSDPVQRAGRTGGAYPHARRGGGAGAPCLARADVEAPGAMARSALSDPALRTAQPASRTGLALGLLAGLALALPFAFAAVPPMDDYPAHLARLFVIDPGPGHPDLARHYRIDWRWTGNLGTDLAILPLARLIGLEPAARLVALLIPVLTGWGLVAVEWSLRRRVGVGALLAMIAVWSPPLRMGFLNYALAVALALWAFALWVRLAERADQRGAGRRGLVFGPVGLVVWLAHVSGWGVLGLMVLGFEIARRRGEGWRGLVAAGLATWPLWPPLAVMLATGGPGGGAALFAGDPGSLAYKKDMLLQVLRGDWRLFDLACLGLVLLAIVEARGRGRLDRRLVIPALLLLGAALVLPRHFAGGDFADARLGPVALMLGCLAIDWPLTLRSAGPVLALLGLRLGLMGAAWHAQAEELARLLPALDQVPRGARVASAVVRDRQAWTYAPFGHVGAWATLRRDALVNAHFALPGIHALQLREAGADFADPSQELTWQAGQDGQDGQEGQAVDLRAFAPARQADYLWYVGPAASVSGRAAPPPVILPPGATILFRTDRSLLARLAPAR